MNILFIGPYRQNDGWGHAAREYLESLKLTGHNITARPVYLADSVYKEDTDSLKTLENSGVRDHDIIIQNCLPNMFQYRAGYKNIGLAYFETLNLECTPWISSINMMDEMWVTSDWEKQNLIDSGVTVPIKKVPIPVDTTKFEKEYKFSGIPSAHKDHFIFYFIGEYITRKDIESLVTAFAREFDPNEPVDLLLKLNIANLDNYKTFEIANQRLQELKQRMGLYTRPDSYKSELLVTSRLPEEELMGLHQACNCFVAPSSGEAFCKPALDAMGFGNIVIANRNTSMTEFVQEKMDIGRTTIENSSTGILVKSHLQPAMAPDRPLPYLYNGRDSWYKIDTLDLQRAMRCAFDADMEGCLNMGEKGKQKALEYSYQNVANRMKEVLG